MEETLSTNWRNTFSLLAGLICSLLLTGSCYIYIFFILHLDMFGYEEVISPEARDLEYVLSMGALSLATIGIALWLRYVGKIYGGIGFYIPVAPTLILLLLFCTRYMIKSNYYQTFDGEVWAKDKPVKMMRKIVKTKMLIGKTKREVEAMLGPGSKEKYNQGKQGVFYYYDNNYRAILEITYKNNITTETDIGCYCD